MKIVYISGKYSAPTIRGVQQNIEKASEVAYKYWKLGYAVICPHKNTAFFDGENDTTLWLEGDLEILKRCDIVVMLSGWQDSRGAIIEHKLAKQLNKKIIYD